MPRYRTKIHEVDAVQFKTPLTISGSSEGDPLGNQPEAKQVNVGDWLLTHPDGTQECISDTDFKDYYEQIHVARRGRPPKHGTAAVASPKRRTRRSKSRKNRKAEKAAA